MKAIFTLAGYLLINTHRQRKKNIPIKEITLYKFDTLKTIYKMQNDKMTSFGIHFWYFFINSFPIANLKLKDLCVKYFLRYLSQINKNTPTEVIIRKASPCVYKNI